MVLTLGRIEEGSPPANPANWIIDPIGIITDPPGGQ